MSPALRSDLPATLPAQQQVEVARTREHVDRLRAVWSELPLGDVDADIDYFLTQVEHAGPDVQPHVVHLKARDGRPLLVVARREPLALPLRMGYLTLARPTVRALVVSFGGVLGVTGDEDAEDAVGAVMRSADGDVAAVLFQKLPTAGEMCRAARRSRPSSVVDPTSRPELRWVVDVGCGYPELLARRSSRARKQLRYYERRLEKKYGAGLRLRRFSLEAELEELWAAMSRVSASTYQRRLGAGFDRSTLQCELMRTAAEKGWLRAWVLYLSDEPVAYWFGVLSADSFGVDCPGFDPRYADDNVGTVTMMRMLEDLCAEPEVRWADFGSGDAEYKRSLGGERVEVSDVLLLSRRPRLLLLLSLRRAATRLETTGRSLLARAGADQWLRRQWRRRLAAAPRRD